MQRIRDDSLPVPDSPVMSTVTCDWREPADRPEHFLHRLRLAQDLRGRFAHFVVVVSRMLSSTARRISSTA